MGTLLEFLRLQAIWLIAALVLILLPGGILLTLYHRLKKRWNQLKTQETVYQSLLTLNPIGWCWWFEGELDLVYSDSLIQLLHLNQKHPLTLRDIVNQFDLTEALLLESHLIALKKTHHFSVELRSMDGEQLVKVEGRYRKDSVILLSFQDITYKVEEDSQQLQALRTLTKERDLLRTLAHSIPVALWYRDANCNISYCNSAYANALELTVGEVLETHKELMDPTRKESAYYLARRVRETGIRQSLRTHVVIDGVRRLLELTEIPLPDQDNSIGYALDLTEVEESLAELNRHIMAHQQVLHHLSTPVAVFGSDTRLLFFNQSYVQLFGLDEHWCYTRPTLGEVIENLRSRRKLPEHRDFPAFKREELARFRSLLSPIQELVHQPDGRILRSITAPHPLGGLLYLFDDVTDKLALERRYNTLSAVQKETIDHLYEGIMVLGSDNRLRLSNPAFCDIWKLEGEEQLAGRHAIELLDEIKPFFVAADWTLLKEELLQILEKRQQKSQRIVRLDSSVIQFSYVPLPDGSHLMTFVDVSDSWRFEKALEERNRALEQADRLKSDFISHVSYELRAPLNTIMGFVDILSNQYFGSLNERQMDYCRGIVDSSQRLLTLINDMLDLASIEAGQLALKPHPADLDTFLNSVIGLVYSRAHDHGVEILKDNQTDLKSLIADERRLKQAMFKLLTNAIKFTPSGGQITVRAAIKNEETEATGESQRLLGLAVSDTGVGMNAEEQAFLFKLFDRPLNSFARRGGAGLGLPLVKSLIELHGGSIEIESLEGVGTTVICWIPLVTPLQEEGEEEEEDPLIHGKTAPSPETDAESSFLESKFTPFPVQDFL